MHTFAPPSPNTPPTEQLTGAVERVTFDSKETGFCVLRVKVRGHRDLVTVVGTPATITPGEYIEGQGVWVNDRTHGLQFKTQALWVVPASTPEGIEKYLGSGMVKGIGPHFAKKLIQAFGEAAFLAQRLGIPRDAIIRAQASVWHHTSYGCSRVICPGEPLIRPGPFPGSNSVPTGHCHSHNEKP